MPDALGADTLYPALFRFALDRLER